MQKIRLSAVSYLNTKPFIYGYHRSGLASQCELSLDIPSVCAEKLRTGEVDLALTPVAILPLLPKAYLVSNYCIGSVGAVKTVNLYAEQSLENIERIYLDFHSRTSVELIRLLCKHYWKIQPEFLPAPANFESLIQGSTAGLIIGDRTIGKDGTHKYVYDLGEAWTNWTGMPFVFAAWVSTKPLPAEFVGAFNHALETGLNCIPELIQVLPTVPGFDLEEYFNRYISYQLDDAKWLALNHFLQYLAGPEFRIERMPLVGVGEQ